MKSNPWTLFVVSSLIVVLGAAELLARGAGGGMQRGGGGGGRPEGGGGAGGRGGNFGGEGARGGAYQGNRAGEGGAGRQGAGARNAAGQGPGNRGQAGSGGQYGNRGNSSGRTQNQTGSANPAAGAPAPTITSAPAGRAHPAGAGYHPNGNYANHGAYNGAWNNNRGWGYGAEDYAASRRLAYGMGAWGMGAMATAGAAGMYSNPYSGAASGGGGGSPATNDYNYAQPVPVTGNVPSQTAGNAPAEQVATNTPAAPAPEPAADTLNPAMVAFKEGDYATALNLVNQEIRKSPEDGVLHEFRALVLFANKDFQQAAATIHSVLAVGPGWDWTTLCSFYDDMDVYNRQLRALGTFVREHSQDGAGHFLLAYHELTCGHADTAVEQLQQVVKLVPDDRVAAELLKMASSDGQPGTEQAPVAGGADQPASAGAEVDPASLVGTWKAAPQGGPTFALSLTPDSKFTWKFTQKGKATEFSGTYSVEGDVLTLDRGAAGAFAGNAAFDGAGAFTFKPVGAPPAEPGLSFRRS